MTSNNIHLDGALAWYDAGFSVIPTLADGTKRPFGPWKNFTQTRATREQVEQWFKTSPNSGVGVIMGEVSGFTEMFELEGRALSTSNLDKIQAVAEDCDATDLWNRFFDTGYRELTPSGGIHIIYALSEGAVEGNTKIARRPATVEELEQNPNDRVKVLAETRGEGGFVVVAPSSGTVHKTGDAWTAVGDCTPFQILPITPEERDLIHHIVHMALDEMPVVDPRPAPTAPAQFSSDDMAPGADYNQREDWWTLLTSYGWTFHSNLAGNEQAWTRPGKRAVDGQSATLFYKGSDNLFVFSSSTELPQEQPISKFAFYTYMEHRGDFSAAARALRVAGYGSPRDVVDLSGWVTAPDVQTARVLPDGGTAADVGSELVPASEPVRLAEWNETGVAHLMLGKFGDKFRLVHEERGWRVYDGGRWDVSKRAEVRQAAEDATGAVKKYASSLLAQAEDGGDKDEIQLAKQNLRTANSLRNARGIKGVVERFADQRGVAVEFAQFDQRQDLLCLDNGTFDLKTMVLREHRPADMLTKKIPVVFDASVQAPRWLRYLEEVVPDEQDRLFLQRACGMALLGDTSNAAFLVLHGKTGCGKSTLLEVVSAAFGEYGRTAAASTFRAQRDGAQGPTNNLHDLMGSRLVVTSETAEGARLDEELIKRITGGDQVTSRQMFERNITWRPRFTMFMATNFPPNLSANDGAIWRRVKPVHFPNTFYGDNGGTPELGLAQWLIDHELAGVFNWLLEGVRMFRTSGLSEPDSMKRSVADYRREMDPVQNFLASALDDQVLVKRADASIPSNTLYNTYVKWSTDNNLRPMGINKFSNRMTDLGFEAGRASGGGRIRHGLALNPTVWLGEAQTAAKGTWT